jgi:hypothetical protein
MGHACVEKHTLGSGSFARIHMRNDTYVAIAIDGGLSSHCVALGAESTDA